MSESVVNIAVIATPKLCDYEFCHRIISVSQMPGIEYLIPGNSYYDEYPKLKFEFGDKDVILFQNKKRLAHTIQEQMLIHTDGIIFNLAGRGLDVTFWNHPFGYGEDGAVIWLEKYLEVMLASQQPLVFALEDIVDGTTDVLIPTQIDYQDEEGRILGFSSDSQPAREAFSLLDDLWQPTSQTIATLRQQLGIPENIPMLPYSHTKPWSIKRILKFLLAKIEATSV